MEKRARPRVTEGDTERVATGCGYLYVTPNRSEGVLIEVFTQLGKAGGCARAQLEALSRSISLGLKYGIPVEEYIDEFKGIRCPSPAWEEGEAILSCADAVAKVLKHACGTSESDKISE